jgi:ABC-type multidrug transport system, ATPase and permease components
MSNFHKAMKIYLKGCKACYFVYFVILLFTIFISLISTYASKVLIDILNAQNSLGLSYNSAITMQDIDNNILEILFVNSFGGITFLSTNLYMFAVILISLTLINMVLLITRLVMRSFFSSKMGSNMQSELFFHIERFPYAKLKQMKPGDILQASTRDEEVFRQFISRDMHSIMYTVYIVTFAFVLLMITNTTIALISLAVMPVMFIYSFFLIKEVRRRYKLTDDSESEMSGKIEENLSSIRLVKAFNNEKFEINEFEKNIKDYEKKYIYWRKLSAFFFSSSDIFVFSQIALTTAFGFYLYYLGVNGDPNGISLGTFYVSFTFVNMMVWPIRDLATILSNLARASASLDRINMILNEPLEDIYSGETPTIKGDIEFKNVSFMFCDSKEPMLKNISFKIKAGQTVAIMGKTGCGKTTLAYLLTRLYDCSSGEILLDGINICNIQKHYLRTKISTVLQDPFLFSKTIEENIKIAKPDATADDVQKASRISHIHDNIVSFKSGYQTPVGERGTTLSGGQKQRVAIARTLITQAPVIIFDDSLSAVDTETDYEIRKSLQENTDRATTLIITHRVATAKDADLIIVLEDGKISQIGKHNDLINQEGLYKRICNIQTKMV